MVTSASGRNLSAEGLITLSRGRDTRSGALTVSGDDWALIESSWVKTGLAGVSRVRSTSVVLSDHERWAITTEPPDGPRRTRSVAGFSYGARPRATDRIARVTTDDGTRTLAEARWPSRRLQKEKSVESLGLDVSTRLERLVAAITMLGVAATPHIAVGDESLWLLPVTIPGRFRYGLRLGEDLTLLVDKGGRVTRLVPDRPVPLEAALLSWHIAIGDVFIRDSSGGG